MRHLVLGGGGFIGSHLASRLANLGHEVAIVDVKFEDFRKDLYKFSRRIDRDLRLNTFPIANERWDVIWQLAADMGGVEYFHSEHDWQAAVNNQMINTMVMSAIAKYNPDARVVFTSTACALATEKQRHTFREHPSYLEVYGYNHTNQWELTEEDISWGTPDQLYGQEKRNSAILWQSAPLDTRVCFLHTVYGPYQEHSGIRMKFPSAVAMKARRARETGTLELLGDGRQVRTYLYIDDAIDRLLALGNSTTDPGFVNIGGVKPYTVTEVADVACYAAGMRYGDGARWGMPEFVYVPGPTGVEARAADMTKFNTIFPQFSPGHVTNQVTLKEGMRRFISWLDEVDG